ncbi:hypothetical protein GCK32_021813 [Trichostrongylus colubriformis]|uniref:DUF1758 domain-containing protein n=1 Tax=Trichostrongylus colubriformis TaxID=6319 RepID=A0AAN8FW26_TRICO
MSGIIRQQIGIAKRQIIAALQEEERERIDIRQIPQLSDDDLLNEYERHTSAHDSIYRAYSRLDRLWKQWQLLIIANPEEDTLLQKYINKYGDFQEILENAVSVLQKLDKERPVIEEELTKRQLPFEPYEESDTDSQRSTEPATSHRLHKSTTHQSSSPAATANIHYSTAIPHCDTTPLPRIPSNVATSSPVQQSSLSFVDASILSKLDLPMFDGNLLEFPEYWARFSTLVGNKSQLDGATKLSLLKSTLRGRALQTIQGLSVTAANYPVAVEILKNHFDDQVTIRHILYTRLASLPPCDKDGRNLFALYSQMYALVRQFTTYEDDSKEYALGAILLNKLPRYIRSRIYDQSGNHENLVPTELLQILTKIVRKESTLEEMEDRSLYPENGHMYAALHHQAKASSFPRRTSSLQNSMNREATKTCSFCGSNNHNASSCLTYRTIKERLKIIKTKRLCYNCLSSRHATKECTSQRSCVHCSRRHHSSICQIKSPPNQPNQRPRFRQFRPSLHTSGFPPPSPHGITSTHSQPSRPTNRSYMTIEDGNQSILPTTQDSSSPPFMNPKPTHPQPPSQPPDRYTESRNKKEQYGQNAATKTPSSAYAIDVIASSKATGKGVLMCTSVTLFNPEDPSQQLQTTAFFDSGASISMINRDIAKNLNLNMEEEQPLSLRTFGKEGVQTYPSSKATVGLLLENYDKFILNVQTLPFLTEPMHMELLVQQQCKDVRSRSITTQPGMVIGNDYFWELVLSSNFYVKSLPNGYNLIHTRVGNIITGKPLQSHQCVMALTIADELEHPLQHQKLEELVEKFWSLESAGIVDDISQSDDNKCLQEFNDTIYFNEEEGRYMVQLPFKEDISDLSDNFDMAISRLKSTVNVLSRHSGLLERYHGIIMEQLEKGIIEEVDHNDNPILCHYLPHHGVISESSKTTKLRCVYDGSAKIKGKRSLNDVLHRGPVLLPEIPGILLRIRCMKILLIGDIEKAFLMVGLDKESRNFTRFLWLQDPSQGVKEHNIVTSFYDPSYGLTAQNSFVIPKANGLMTSAILRMMTTAMLNQLSFHKNRDTAG